jgi:hypothetical protein
MALAQPCRPRCDAQQGRLGCARPPSAIAGARGLSAQSPSSSSSSARRNSSALARASPSARSIAGLALPTPASRCRVATTTSNTTPRASASASSAPSTSTATATATATTTFSFACPICHDTPFRLPAADPYGSDCACPRCGRTFLVSRGAGGHASSAFVDLTLQSGAQPQVFEQRSWVGTELFRTEAVSSIYERGWRQGFARAGFPGPQREFDLAMRYFAPVLSGSGGAGGEGAAGNDRRPVLVDASCGTGLFTRLFARSGEFSGVVALDYSETMLRETRRLLAASR